MRTAQFAPILIAILVVAVDHAQCGIVYMRSRVGRPFNSTGNEGAMNSVFGVGGWQDLQFDNPFLDPTSVFSTTNSFIFLEGGDDNANELEAFLQSNRNTVEDWVAAGGSLFVNAAPTEGNGMVIGFGAARVRLNYGAPQYFENNGVRPVDSSHPIFSGPFTPASRSFFDGNAFAHASITGTGLTNILVDRAADGSVHLAEMDFGLGHVIFGGMTPHNFHTPSFESWNLRRNILAYGAAQAHQVSAVPEPSSLALLGMGVAGLCGYRRRRKRTE